jgi:predicted aspartyl protease
MTLGLMRHEEEKRHRAANTRADEPTARCRRCPSDLAPDEKNVMKGTPVPTLSPRRAAAIALSVWMPLAALVSVLPPVAHADPAAPPDRYQQGYVVPFTPVPDDHGGPLVKVRIDDKADATFIVDTGTNGCMISESLAAKLHLPDAPTPMRDGKPDPDILFGKTARAVKIRRLELAPKPGGGPMVFQAVDGGHYVVAKDSYFYVAPGVTVDGILGANFLVNFAASFDFSADQMILIQPGVMSAHQVGLLGYGQAGGTEFPLKDKGTDTERDEFSVSALLGSGTATRSVDLEVDTGSKVTTIPRDAAQALSLKPEGEQPVAGGTSGDRVLDRSTVSSLSLGDIRVLDRPVLYPDKGDYPSLLGMDILKGYKILIDYPARKVYLMPNLPIAPVQIKPAAPSAPAPTLPPVTATPAPSTQKQPGT